MYLLVFRHNIFIRLIDLETHDKEIGIIDNIRYSCNGDYIFISSPVIQINGLSTKVHDYSLDKNTKTRFGINNLVFEIIDDFTKSECLNTWLKTVFDTDYYFDNTIVRSAVTNDLYTVAVNLNTCVMTREPVTETLEI